MNKKWEKNNETHKKKQMMPNTKNTDIKQNRWPILYRRNLLGEVRDWTGNG